MFDPRLINLFNCMFLLYSAARNHKCPCHIQYIGGRDNHYTTETSTMKKVEIKIFKIKLL